jgi:hypothetical protein
MKEKKKLIKLKSGRFKVFSSLSLLTPELHEEKEEEINIKVFFILCR